jgi:hypothetical protein
MLRFRLFKRGRWYCAVVKMQAVGNRRTASSLVGANKHSVLKLALPVEWMRAHHSAVYVAWVPTHRRQ